MRAKCWTSILFVALLALAIGLAACEKKTETPVEPPPPPPPVEEPAVPTAAAPAEQIPAEYVAAAGNEVTEENAEAVADQLEKDLEAELAEE